VKMSEMFCYLSGFFTGVGVTCIVLCIHLRRIRKQLAEARERLREVIEELEEEGVKVREKED